MNDFNLSKIDFLFAKADNLINSAQICTLFFEKVLKSYAVLKTRGVRMVIFLGNLTVHF
jgi:hypothetical protein